MATELPEAVTDDEAIVPVEDFVAEDAVVLYRKPENAIEDLTWNPEAAVAAIKGMPLAITNDRGKVVPCLYYDIPYGSRDEEGEKTKVHVRGPSAPLMRALVAQRGNFETVSVDVQQGVQIVPEVVDGQREIHQFPAIRATVRVRDLANNNVTVGVVTEPMFGRSRKSGLYAIPLAEAKAISIATRNARAEHFAPVLPLLMQVLVREFEAGNAVVKGELPDAVVLGALEAKRERAGRENRELVQVGVLGAQAFFAELEALKPRLSEDKWKALGQDWRKAEAVLCGGVKLQDAPQPALDRCRRWLSDKQAELGLTETVEVVADEPPPAYDSEGQPKVGFVPSPSDVKAVLDALDDDARNDLLERAKVSPEEKFTAEARKRIWDEAHRQTVLQLGGVG